MNESAIPTATNKRISELYQSIKAKNLILQPEFQRKLVWNDKHRQTFIETILKGLPFPEIYTADRGVNLDTIVTQNVVVDGQQRLSTIVQYIDGELNINPRGNVRPYKDLPEQEQKNFLSYKVVVRDLGDISSATIKEIFRRINLTRYPLNAYEIHNALYEGEFMNTAKAVLKESRFKELPTFSEVDSSRMQDLGFLLLTMSTIENGGYFTGNKEIEKYIQKYNDRYENKSFMKDKLIYKVDYIKKLNLPDDSIWFSKSNLFTLFVEISSVETGPGFKDKLIVFEKALLKNKNADSDNDYSRYYSYVFTGTNSRKARVERSRIFRKHVLGLIDQD